MWEQKGYILSKTNDLDTWVQIIFIYFLENIAVKL